MFIQLTASFRQMMTAYRTTIISQFSDWNESMLTVDEMESVTVRYSFSNN